MPRGGEKDGEKPKNNPASSGESADEKHEKKKPRKLGGYHNRNRNSGRRYIGKNRYPGPERRHFNKRPRFEVGERLKETDLGITEYARDEEGFTGTIKERFTDFMVHEICPNGEIAKLTSREIPVNPEDLESIEDLKKKVPEEIWDQLQKINESSLDLEIDVTNMDKDQRKNIHQVVKKLSTVVSETKDIDGKKIMVFSKQYTKSSQIRQDWSARGGDYCHFILHKVNLDTMDALNQIAKVLRLKTNIFSYAGTKDRRAKTTQWISVKKMSPKRIMDAATIVRGVYVGNFKFEKEPLKLGKLEGNRFTITLRNVTASDEIIEKAMLSLQNYGFINYYGLQRFGTIASIPTYEIGKALLQGKWEEAANLILKPRDGEQDLRLVEARKIYQETKDPRLAYEKIGRHDRIEAKLLWGLHTRGQTNIQGALDNVPRNTILMYIHSYQSIVWNKIVSKRIKEFGLKPIAGDLVYENPDSKDDIETEEHPELNESDAQKQSVDAVNGDDQKGNVKTEKGESKNEDKTSEKNHKEELKELPKVKILTKEDLSKYTIFDIVMPQPGWKVTYPSYAKSWFEEHLEKDGLTTDLQQKNKKYSLSGSYRKIVQKPENLNWKIMHYANKTDDLIVSDIDEMRQVQPPKDNPEGAFKALIIQMSLKSSSYATMALREVLKCDTSSQTHAAQSAAFHAAHEAKNKEKNENSKLNVSHGDLGHSTEDESSDKKRNISTVNSSLDDSQIENNKSVIANGAQKHEIDHINDSGIDSSTVISA